MERNVMERHALYMDILHNVKNIKCIQHRRLSTRKKHRPCSHISRRCTQKKRKNSHGYLLYCRKPPHALYQSLVRNRSHSSIFTLICISLLCVQKKIRRHHRRPCRILFTNLRTRSSSSANDTM